MDEEWEILPTHDGFLDYYGGNRRGNKTTSPTKIVFNTDYFVCPSSSPPNNFEAKDLVPVLPMKLEPGNEPDAGIPKEVTLVPPVIIPKEAKDSGFEEAEADHDSVSQQVSFKKMKDNEFVDMKLGSPRMSLSSPTKGFLPQIDAAAASFGFDEDLEGKITTSPRIEKNEKASSEDEAAWGEEENGGGVNLWKWSLTGVGAICSFGVAAAATICIIILQKGNQHQNQNLGLHIYSDDKRIKQVVHHATKLNEAISVARGVPITRAAQITFGGYYDGL